MAVTVGPTPVLVLALLVWVLLLVLVLLTGVVASCRSADARWSATGRGAVGEPSAVRDKGAAGSTPSRESDGEGEGAGEGNAVRWAVAVGEPTVVGLESAAVFAAVSARGPGAGSSAVAEPPPSALASRPEGCAGTAPADGAADGGRAGSVRRWTGADADLVNGAGPLGGGGVAGDTRMPRAGGTEAGRAACAGRAATTGTSGRAGAVGTDGRVDALDEDGPGAPAGPGRSEAGSGTGAGSGPGARIGACAGVGAGAYVWACGDGSARCSGVARGGTVARSGSASAAAGAARRLLIRPPGPASSTAWERTPMKEGFCQVASRPPKPASATPDGPAAAVRRMGGRAGQA
ncbi:hypothetical protein KMT30_44895, partial [Streptomyces sp. IBSBF 2953]|nr:hypothetical protein [Streptomyces hayashii]